MEGPRRVSRSGSVVLPLNCVGSDRRKGHNLGEGIEVRVYSMNVNLGIEVQIPVGVILSRVVFDIMLYEGCPTNILNPPL